MHDTYRILAGRPIIKDNGRSHGGRNERTAGLPALALSVMHTARGRSIFKPIYCMTDKEKKQIDGLLEAISDEVLIREIEKRGYTIFKPLEPTDWDMPKDWDDFPDLDLEEVEFK